MLVSYNWLKEYVDIDVSAHELAEIITRAGIEIGGVRDCAEGISGVVVAEVLTCDNHPDSDHLHVCVVTTDGDDRVQVVCGAPNVSSGQKVCFAQVGAVLPGGIKIGQAKLRGIDSYGMICSMQELGVEDDLVAAADKSGIVVLEDDAPIGKDAVTYLGLNDYVYDVDLTPNRSDCLSVYNIAREVGALLQKPVREIDVACDRLGAPVADDMKVHLADGDLCQRYVGHMVRGCKPVRSPRWMEHRLQCAGIRPIHFLVDVTNYVMLELGQPLHAFDAEDISGKEIIVRRAKSGETITTLDNQLRHLNEEMLLITDRQRAIGIAGVMGGQNTEIKADTKDVFLESAWFEPRNIRRTSLKLALRTEASIRNEKGLNPDGVYFAAERAVSLIHKYAGGIVASNPIDEQTVQPESTQVRLRYQLCNDRLGTDIESDFMVQVLKRLHFDILEETDESVLVKVPGWRPDISIEEDLVEEIARIYGYDNIPSTLPFGATHSGTLTQQQRLRQLVNRYLAYRGLHEVITYSFTRRKVFDQLRYKTDDLRRQVIPVDNPLSEDLAIMRTTLLSGLLDVVKTNLRHDVNDITVFESGRVFLGGSEVDKDVLVDEQERVAVAITGNSSSHWLKNPINYDYFYLKGLVEDLFEHLFMPKLTFVPLVDDPTWHPGCSAEVWLNDRKIGIIGEVHPLVLKNWGIREKVFAAEIDLAPIYDHGIISLNSISPARYPAMERDLAFVVAETVHHSALEKAIVESSGKLLKSVNLFDLYQGEPLAEGEKSLAYKLRFQSNTETLTDAIIDIEIERILLGCAERCQARLRA